MAQLSAFASMFGGGGGFSSTPTNRSVNIVGGQNPGGINALNQLINIANGPTTNGGYDGLIGAPNSIYGGLKRAPTANSANIAILAIVAGVGLVAYLALKG